MIPGDIESSDAIIRVVILVGVLALVMGRRKIPWGNVMIALLIIAALAVVIDKFFL
ncbi:MAG: hypothetical protein ACRC5A_08255 [Enterobacteriaceae bacterium]